jgi:hypothetical protein
MSSFLTGLKKEGFTPPINILLDDVFCGGPSKFTFLSEYTSFLKIALWRYEFDGKSTVEINELIIKSVRDSEFNPSKIFKAVAEKQIKFIMDGNLPLPPFFMGGVWDLSRSSKDILNILKEVYFIDLSVLGFSSKDLDSIWAQHSSKLLDVYKKDSKHLNLNWLKTLKPHIKQKAPENMVYLSLYRSHWLRHSQNQNVKALVRKSDPSHVILQSLLMWIIVDPIN